MLPNGCTFCTVICGNTHCPYKEKEMNKKFKCDTCTDMVNQIKALEDKFSEDRLRRIIEMFTPIKWKESSHAFENLIKELLR